MEYQSGVVSPIQSISNGWNLIKDDYWTFFGMTLVSIFIVSVVTLLFAFVDSGIQVAVAAGLGISMKDVGEVRELSTNIVPAAVSLIFNFFSGIIIGAISGIFFCGIYSAMSRKAANGIAQFGDLFSQFGKLVPCLVFSTIMSAIQFVFGLIALLGGAALGVSINGAGLLKDGKLNSAVFGGLFLVIIGAFLIAFFINLIISVLTAFFYPLLAERNLSGIQALVLSAKGGLGNFFGIFLLLLLLCLMAIGGAFACLIGVLFVVPIISAAIFSAYRSVFGAGITFTPQHPPPPPNFSNQPGY